MTDFTYLKAIAENLEAIAGTSGAEENMTYAGYLKRIEDATEQLNISSPRIFAQSAVSVLRTGSTTETSMVEIPIPAGTLGINGHLRVSAQYRRTTGASKIGARCRFGPAGTAGTSLVLFEPATDGTIQFDIVIAARGTNNSQIASLALLGMASLAPVATAFDMTATQYITLTGRTEGNSADVLELQRYQVLLFPKA